MPYRSITLELSSERREWTFIKISLGIVLGLFLLIGAIWIGHDAYSRWQENRLLRRANLAIQQGDNRTASLAARAVLQSRPDSAGAARIMAQLGERAGDRGALDWRRKVAQLQPQSVEAALEWARSAVLFNDLPAAERALAQIPESGRETSGYHAVAALVAQNRHQDEKAESEWKRAVNLAPEEKAYQLQLGIVQVRSSDPKLRSAGERILMDLRNDPRQRLDATRALIMEGVSKRHEGHELVALAREVQTYPDATLADRIMYLDFMHQVQDPQFSAYLSELEKMTAPNPVALAQLLSWMSIKNLNLVALDFLKTLPPETRAKWPVQLAVADIYLHLRDWPGLVGVTKDATWKQNFLRHAFYAHALRAQDKSAAAEREWAAAVREASNDSSSLLSLISLVSQWRWETETVDLLWALTKRPDKQNEAMATLYRHYSKSNDTQGLYRVLLRLAESDPTNLDVQNNLAQISLLLNAQPDDARRSAADLYHKKPSNPAYAATYAFALLTKGNVQEAERIMDALSEEQRRDPAISAYYGICLAAAKDSRARAFLETGRDAVLLPEEKTLIDQALARLGP
jgi:thioredoxin-like negative regulator of GroEL